MAPAIGWPMPQSRFCSASANANTSRPQPLACDIGVKKNPSAERGPNDSTETRQPQIATAARACQDIAGRIRSVMDILVLLLGPAAGSKRSRSPQSRPQPNCDL